MKIIKKYNSSYKENNNTMKKNIYSKKIIFIIILFFIISLISIFASLKNSSDKFIFIKQLIFYIIGTIVLCFSYCKKDDIFQYDMLFYISLNLILILLLFLGISINGSKCWIIIGPFSFQPSEFMKISLIITISKILDKYKNKKSFKSEISLLIKTFFILLIPSILTFLEPDTGVVIIYFIITIGMLLYRGLNKKWYLFTILIFSITLTSLTYLYFSKKDLLLNLLGNNSFYRLERIINWQNGSGYQLDNSLIAISSSGLFGFGFNNTPLYFPEASTDFIFTTFSSNFGLMGNIVLLIIFIIFDINILSLIRRKTKMQYRYFLIGAFTMIFYQQIQNIGMTIGLLPITGITLPFISYGGSSLLSYMFLFGLVLKISDEQFNYIN